MPKNKWPKRWMKIKGASAFVYSLCLLRYTSFNAKNLAAEIHGRNVNRLHVGCGDVLLDDWLNILFETRQEYGRLQSKSGALFLNYNLLKPWPIEDGSIEYIAGSHFIEHIDLNAGLQFMGQAYRVLKSGGRIRLSCPDMEIYARNYIQRNSGFYQHEKIKEWCAFKNAKTPGAIFAAKAYDSGGAHKWFYDFETLKCSLEQSGFTNVQKLTRLEGQVPDLEKLEPPERELETLYVEAVKP